MRKLLLAVPLVVLLAACASNSTPIASAPDTGAASSAPASDSPSPEASCTLPNGRDVLVREITPNLPPAVQELGEVDLQHCQPTIDSLKGTSPTDSGYCTQVAWAADNPGYDTNAVPAPPLKKVIEEFGPAC